MSSTVNVNHHSQDNNCKSTHRVLRVLQNLVRLFVFTIAVIAWSASSFAEEINPVPDSVILQVAPPVQNVVRAAPSVGETPVGRAAEKPVIIRTVEPTVNTIRVPRSENPSVKDAKPSDKPADGTVEESATTAAAKSSSSGSSEPSIIESATKGAAELKVKTVNGSFVYNYGIDLPAFQGITPKLTLNYSSARKVKTRGQYQGWLGYGWGFAGFDVIERASPGKGAPHFDGNDIYLLNGEELIPCPAGTNSPGCLAGGTHASEVENYQRITRSGSGATGTWTITNRIGTRFKFKTVASHMASPPNTNVANDYRWLLSEVIDTHGNQVVYSYSCPTAPVCYPSSISYNGTTVTFYAETRPDKISYATGKSIATIHRRIKTIRVLTSGQMHSAYKISYQQSANSNASQINRITRYGNNAVISSGNITRGWCA